MIWNTAFSLSPAGSDAPSTLDNRIRELKEAIYERVAKEHVMSLASGLAGEDGYHKAGSANAFYAGTAPTTLPDGTVLGAAHAGWLWYDTAKGVLRVWSGTAWIAIAPPIGAIYMQFPGKSDPGTLWPNSTWSNISSETLLKGRVPRIEGTVSTGGANASALFGNSQDDQMQLITGSFGLGAGAGVAISASGAFSLTAARSSGVSTTSSPRSDVDFSSANSSGARTGNATRDASVTVRVFQRTA